MKNLSKMLTATLLLSTSLFAIDNDNNVIEFEKKRLAQNPNVKVLDVKINTKKALPIDGWHGYILDVEAKLKEKSINVKDILFSNGRYMALDLIDSKNGKSLKSLVTPNLTAKYYDKSKLIAGDHGAKDKIVVFSDPLCPFCMDYVPEIINFVNKNSDSIALYYYHFPLLRIHPAAGVLSKLMEIGKEKGIKDIEIKVYEADWDKYFDAKLTDEKKILESFNKEFKTSITLAELQDKKLQVSIDKDMKMGEEVMVQGTPTVFLNGVKDNTRSIFKKLGKK